MGSVREALLQRFPLEARARDADDEIANALYALLWSIGDKGMSVDGWAYFRVIRESHESLVAVGLMTLLPSGSIPVEINVRGGESGLVWLAHIARADAAWLALSDPSGGIASIFMQLAIEQPRNGLGMDRTAAWCTVMPD